MSDEKRVLIFGDLHLSDRFSGHHVDYLENCFYCLNKITEAIKEYKATHVVCLGDWTGQGPSEKNLKKRPNLARVINILQEWNRLTNDNVYSLRGNHDIGRNMTDYDLFITCGYLKNVKQLDIESLRLHFFDYGEENREIEIDEDKFNVGCFHSNLLVEGETTWYSAASKERGGVELSSLYNLKGLSNAISGHIHNPSIRMVSTSIGDSNIDLFYPGCPTRPRMEQNMWDRCYFVLLKTNSFTTSMDTLPFDLKPYSEIFTDLIMDEETDKDNELAAGKPIMDISLIGEMMNDLHELNLTNGQDYTSQIKRVAGLDKVAADIALEYLEKAEEEFSN